MALTESYMLPLGRLAPNFSLLNVVTGKQCTLESLKGLKGTLIIFMCNHCPYVVHLIDSLVSSAELLESKDINTIAISSNSIHSHPQDGPHEMANYHLIKSFYSPIYMIKLKRSLMPIRQHVLRIFIYLTQA